MEKETAIKLFKELLEIRLDIESGGIHHHVSCDRRSAVIINKLESNGFGVEFAYSENDYKKAGCIYALVPYEYFNSNSSLSKKSVKEVALVTEDNWGYNLIDDPERD